MHTQNQRTPSAFSAALAGPKAVLNIRLCQALGNDVHAALMLGQLMFWQEHAEWKPQFKEIEIGGVSRWMFTKTGVEIQSATCIKIDTQKRVKDTLKRLGLIEYGVFGKETLTFFWVDIDAVEQLMNDFLSGENDGNSRIGKTGITNRENRNYESGKPDSRIGKTGNNIESILESNNNNKNNPARENENSEAKKYTAEDARNWKWVNPQLDSENIPTDDFGFFDFSAQNEKPKIGTSTVEVKNTETSQNCAVPEFFADATEVHEAIEMLLKTKFQSERFAHHYKIHGGIEFLQCIANFFADPDKALWLLKETGVKNMADVWPVLAAFISEVILKQHGYDRQGDINNHIRNFFSSYTRKTAEVSVAKNLTAAKEVMVKRIEQRNQEFSVKVNQDKIQSSQPQKRNPNVRGLNFLNANG